MKLAYSCLFFLFLINGDQAYAQTSLADYKTTFDSLYFKVKDPGAALHVLSEWEAAAIRNNGAESLERVKALSMRARFLYEVENKYLASDSLVALCIELTEKAGATNAEDFASILHMAGALKAQQYDFLGAIAYFERSISIRTTISGKDNINVLFTQSLLAAAYLELDRFSLAEDLFQANIASFERLHLYRHNLYHFNLRKYGNLLTSQGRFKSALEYQLKSFDLTQENMEDEDYLWGLFDLANGYCESGNLIEAEPLYKKLLKANNPFIKVGGYIGIGDLQYRLDLLEEAQNSQFQLQSILSSIPDVDSMDYVDSYIILSKIYDKRRLFEKADSLRNLALNIISKTKGDTINSLIVVLLESANASIAHDSVARAQVFLQQIIDRYQRQINATPKLLETVLTLQGDLSFQKNNYIKAVNDYSLAIELFKKGSPNYFNIAFKKATALERLHRNEELGNAISELMELKQNALATNFRFLTDYEREKFYNSTKEFRDYAATLLWKTPSMHLNEKVFDFQLFTKSILENTIRKTREYVKCSSDSVVSATYKNWVYSYELMSYAYTLSAEELASNHLNIQALEAKMESLEKEITLLGIPIIPKETLPRWTDIRDALQPGEAAIDIVRIQAYDGRFYQDTILYLVSILKPNIKEPLVFFLENGDELESFIYAQYQNEISRKKILSQALSDRIWGTIASHLQGVKSVYFSPDGIFHKINLNTLRMPDGSYLLDQIDLKQITNLKNILQPERKTSDTLYNSAALFGNPTFHTNFKSETKPSDTDSSTSLYRDIVAEANGDIHLDPLPGSQKEVEQIAEKLSRENWKYEIFTGTNATEEAVKQLKHPKILHIATHGYFLNSDSKKNALGLGSTHAGKNTALRSMLFFAGAENSISGEYIGINDGILTAFEAAVLNLDQTELVVLSACNTGLGKIQNGEGVYGLQRAFRIAGAKSLIMSLWEVEDAATAFLMSSFYENWLSGMSKTAAFHKAQLSLKAKYPQPFYWGSFILVNG